MALTSTDIGALIEDAHRGDGPREVSDIPDDHLFFNEDDAMETAREMGLDDVHEIQADGDRFWVPGQTHTEYLMATNNIDHEMLGRIDVYRVASDGV